MCNYWIVLKVINRWLLTLRYLFCILDNVLGPAVMASNNASTGFPLSKNRSAAVDKFPMSSD